MTPFEKAAHNRDEGMKRLAGILAVFAWQERIKQLRQARQTMPVPERLEWERILLLAMQNQHAHFGYEA